MNREIKFRGWDSYSKKMYRPEDYAGEYSTKAASITILAQRENPMQFTGIQDVVGTDVYEGDIIQFYYAKPDFGMCKGSGTVVYNSSLCAFVIEHPTFIYLHEIQHDSIIITGNIYETK